MAVFRSVHVDWNLSENEIPAKNRRVEENESCLEYPGSTSRPSNANRHGNDRGLPELPAIVFTQIPESSAMTPKVPARARASRYTVPNNERVLILIGAERISGTLCVLSVTGGRMRVVKKREPGTFGEIRINTVAGSITAVIELLAVRHDNVQAFRFVQMEPANRRRLEATLDSMRQQGLGDGRSAPFAQVLSFARRLWPASIRT